MFVLDDYTVYGLTPPLRQLRVIWVHIGSKEVQQKENCIIPLWKGAFSLSEFFVKAALEWNSIQATIKRTGHIGFI